MKHLGVSSLEGNLTATTGDDLFRQRRPGDEGGLARRVFGTLSKYVHGAPNHNDADVGRGNGPVFAPKAFEKWAEAFLTTYALGVLKPGWRSRSSTSSRGVLPSTRGGCSNTLRGKFPPRRMPRGCLTPFQATYGEGQRSDAGEHCREAVSDLQTDTGARRNPLPQ